MRTTALLLSLLLAVSAYAAPSDHADDMERLLAEKGLLGKLTQVTQSMGNKASELVVTALGFLGVPYRIGGNTVDTGFDCSGFVRAGSQKH